MVQQFQVLRCFSCEVFQVQQVKKSKKWACKLCGEKQSLRKVYGQGSGSDCRHHVQKLNLLQGQVEQAAAGENSENAICDDDIGDEAEESLVVSQEAAPMNRWSKYLEDKSDGPCEEEEGRISTDHEHYYSHQDCTPGAVRKRKHFPYYGGAFYKEDLKENISKRNRIDEDGNQSEASPLSSRITEDTVCLKWHDKPLSLTLPLQTTSDTFLPMNTPEGRFKPSACSTTSCLVREPKMDSVINPFHHTKKIGIDCTLTNSQDVLPDDEPTTSRLSAQISSPGLHQSGLSSAGQRADIILKTSSSVSPKKPVLQSNLFQTDDDFDDNY